MLTNGRKLDNRYIILEEIGSGGFGAVYLAEDTRFTGSNRVAIKKIQQSNEQTAKIFQYEANLLYNLSHPNLPKVTNCFQEDGANYIVMDYIGGSDLMAHMKRGKRFSVEEILEISDKVLDALEYLHSVSIFHRDIKPHNIKIDSNGKIFLLDFGTAKGDIDGATASMTDQSITGYTPFYAPLEQILRVDTNSYLLLSSVNSAKLASFLENKTDARGDIYSLGATVYHLLTGFPPEKATATVRAYAIWSGNADPLPNCHSLIPEISKSLSEVIERCLKIEPEMRFQTAQELRAALKSLNGGFQTENHTVPLPANDVPQTQPAIIYTNPQQTQAAVVSLSENNYLPPLENISQQKSSNSNKKNFGIYIGLLILLLFAGGGIGLFAWKNLVKQPVVSSNTAIVNNNEANTIKEKTPTEQPARSLDYSLLVQKMRDGKKYQEPFESSGQEVFENGYQFQVRLTAPETGFLYAFAEGLNDKGERVYSILFPTPKQNNGASEVSKNQAYETSWNEFGGVAGTENFWIVWSQEKNPLIEAVRDNSFQNSGVITGNDLRTKLQSYLESGKKAEKTASKDTQRKLTKVDFKGNNLVYLLQLEHR